MPRTYMQRSLFERWDEKVERSADGCWMWTGAVKDTGYGVLQRGRRGEGLVRAHRFAYEHFVGQIPAGLEVRHSCHNRRCVNPAHLSIGTKTENMRDMVEAGRWSERPPMRGEANGHTKLTEQEVRAILADGRVLRVIAAEFGVSIATVWSIRHRHTWAHIS